MAASKNQRSKKGTARTTSRSTSSGRKNAAKKKSVSSGFQTEIILLIVLAASMILVISNLGMGGSVGDMISTVSFGVVGLLAYIFPVLLFLGAVFLVSNKKNPLAYKKILAGTVFFVFLCGLVQLLTEGYMKSTTLTDYYTLCSDYRTGGGVIGGAVCISSTSAFGVAGGYIIIILVLLITFILITQRSFFGFIFKIWDSIAGAARNGHERYMEGQPERELKKELRQKEKRRKREARQAQRIQELEAALAEEEKEDEQGSSEKVKAPKRGFLEGTKLTRPKEEKGETKTTVQDAVKSSVETSENMQGQFEFKIHRSDSPEEREEMPDNSDDLFSSDDESFSSGVENLPEDDLEEKIISQMYSGEDKTAEPMPEERADRRISENRSSIIFLPSDF